MTNMHKVSIYHHCRERWGLTPKETEFSFDLDRIAAHNFTPELVDAALHVESRTSYALALVSAWKNTESWISEAQFRTGGEWIDIDHDPYRLAHAIDVRFKPRENTMCFDADQLFAAFLAPTEGYGWNPSTQEATIEYRDKFGRRSFCVLNIADYWIYVYDGISLADWSRSSENRAEFGDPFSFDSHGLTAHAAACLISGDTDHTDNLLWDQALSPDFIELEGIEE